MPLKPMHIQQFTQPGSTVHDIPHHSDWLLLTQTFTTLYQPFKPLTQNQKLLLQQLNGSKVWKSIYNPRTANFLSVHIQRFSI